MDNVLKFEDKKNQVKQIHGSTRFDLHTLDVGYGWLSAVNSY